MAVASVSDRELARLFLGDKFSAGYSWPSPVYELCRRWQPRNFHELQQRIFGPLPVREISEGAMDVVEEGWNWWVSDGKPTVEYARG